MFFFLLPLALRFASFGKSFVIDSRIVAHRQGFSTGASSQPDTDRKPHSSLTGSDLVCQFAGDLEFF